jgi:hypothetical protein
MVKRHTDCHVVGQKAGDDGDDETKYADVYSVSAQSISSSGHCSFWGLGGGEGGGRDW